MTCLSLETAALGIYQLAWSASIPFLRYNHRLAEGYAHRRLLVPHLSPADLWIQSASAGEAYLAWEILKKLSSEHVIRALLTTNTSQGMGILQQAMADLSKSGSGVEPQTSYFPFDSPAIMKQAVHLVRPTLMLLLETELWPGLLSSLKQAGCRILVINGRMTHRSLVRYRIWPSFWRRRRPDEIHAVSTEDRDRFAELFGSNGVETMPNIKFDRFTGVDKSSASLKQIVDWLPQNNKLLVLGSIREEEESDVEKIIPYLLERQPDAIIGLFPRHMHRVGYWRKSLQRLGISWTPRSGNRMLGGGVILWDVFGELGLVYPLASAAFVGGSLARLGGQNFLEPIVKGVPTVIGPHWENFKWVGQEILDQGIVHRASSWKEVADFLVARIMNPPDKEALKRAAGTYIKARQGGTDVACGLIRKYLNEGSKGSRVQGEQRSLSSL